MKVSVDTKFLKANLNIKDGELITFVDEGTEGLSSFKTQTGEPRRVFTITVKTPAGEEKFLTLNSSSKKNMILFYGDDSKNWVGKQARVNIVKQIVGKEMKSVIILTAPNVDVEGNAIVE